MLRVLRAFFVFFVLLLYPSESAVLFLLIMSNQLFNTNDENFSIDAHGVILTCERLDIPKQVVYSVKFSSARKPIVVARAKFEDSDARWTSIPEGRQREAEGVGAIIDEYLSRKE